MHYRNNAAVCLSRCNSQRIYFTDFDPHFSTSVAKYRFQNHAELPDLEGIKKYRFQNHAELPDLEGIKYSPFFIYTFHFMENTICLSPVI